MPSRSLACPAVLTTVLLAFASNATATLIDRGGGLIYDDVLDITWLQDASLGGFRQWPDAVAWADALVFGGFDDWRLPSMDVNSDGDVVDCSLESEVACRDSELGYMYYQNFGGTPGQDLRGNQGLIQNVQFFHWSSTVWTIDPGDRWAVVFDRGLQSAFVQGFAGSAWAVRDGDVLAAPEPSTLALMGLGFIGIGFRRRRAS